MKNQIRKNLDNLDYCWWLRSHSRNSRVLVGFVYFEGYISDYDYGSEELGIVPHFVI